MADVIDYNSELAEAGQLFSRFLSILQDGRSITILSDGDVDGLGAAVVLWHLLVRRGTLPELISTLHPTKGENAFSLPTARAIDALSPTALFVLDLGVSSRPFLPGVPKLYIDHHHPTGETADGIAISGYNWRPVPTSSLLTYLLCNAHGEVADKAWVAAIGNMGDMGPAYPELDAAARVQRLKRIREAITLLNAAKRSGYDIAIGSAFRLLRDATTAQEIVESDADDARLLRRCLAEVKAALAEAKRLAPRFSKTEKVALLEFSSPSRVHPLLAQSWHGRLKGYIVIAANKGFLPGRVAFSLRTSGGQNLLEFLARFRHAVPGEETEYGHGHDQAAGGVISVEAWERLKVAMGF